MTKQATWTTRDGNVIAIRDMTDSHLQNTCNMLLRKAWRLHFNELMQSTKALQFCNGEMAQDAIQSELDALAEEHPINFVYDKYAPLFNAAKHRRLQLIAEELGL